MKLCEDPPFAKNAKGRGTRRLFPLPTHWATLEDNDDVERMEKEPFDIKKNESGITLLRIGFIYGQPGQVHGRLGDWVIESLGH